MTSLQGETDSALLPQDAAVLRQGELEGLSIHLEIALEGIAKICTTSS